MTLDEVQMDTDNRIQFIRQKHLLPLLGFSAATLWRKVKEGKFPKPVKLSENITAWQIKEVEKWIQGRING